MVAGHTRLKAAKMLNRKTVPCIVANDLSEEQIKAFRLADNKTSEFADWDFDILSEELNGILGIDMSDFGFEEIADWETVEDDYEIEVPIEPKSKRGEIYKLGRHRLMCGDSTSAEDVAKLMDGQKMDMVFTDPPYDMDMGGQGCFKKSMKNCKQRVNDIIKFDPYCISFISKLNVDSFYIFTSKNGISKYLDIFKDFNYDILCWCKTNPVPFVHGSFLPDIEYLLFFSRKGRIWNNSLKPTSVYRKYYVTQKLQGRTDGGGDLHPTMKPIEIVVDKIKISSNKNGGVLELFGGSGTTLIACEETDRNCYMMEHDPKYIDVIIDRWEQFTGEKAELIV